MIAPIKRRTPLFSLGQLVATPGAVHALEDSGELPTKVLIRHQLGDWGDVCREDREENELSVKQGFRILSSYTSSKEVKLWVITEADRSATTILLPREY